jgi:hypothetical protein
MQGSSDVIGLEPSIQRFKMYKDTPCHAVFETLSKHLKYRYRGGDVAESAVLFAENMAALKDSGTGGEYMVCFYESLGEHEKLNVKTPCSGSFTFRVNDPQTKIDQYAMQRTGGAAPVQNEFLELLKQERAMYRDEAENLKAELAELKEDYDELERELEDVKTGTGNNNTLGGILKTVGEHDWAKDFLKDLATGFRAWSGGTRKAPQPQYNGSSATINGTNSNPSEMTQEQFGASMNESLATLHAWYVEHYQEKGNLQMVMDMKQLASLTADTDVMELALKKLRAF